MMQMLEAGGMPVLVDGERPPDQDNPRGYYELSAVRSTRRDSAWIGGAAGHAVKVVSSLLRDLPADRRYRVLFMRRPLGEVLTSQRAMLARRGVAGDVPGPEIAEAMTAHVAEVEDWLATAPHMEILWVSYHRLLADPLGQAGRAANFVGAPLDVTRMAAVVEPGLYRQRCPADRVP